MVEHVPLHLGYAVAHFILHLAADARVGGPICLSIRHQSYQRNGYIEGDHHDALCRRHCPPITEDLPVMWMVRAQLTSRSFRYIIVDTTKTDQPEDKQKAYQDWQEAPTASVVDGILHQFQTAIATAWRWIDGRWMPYAG